MIVYIFRESAFMVFTQVPDVLEVVRTNYIYLVIGMPLGSISSILSGTMKGLGKQNVALWQTFYSAYMLGLPLACAFAFYFGFGLTGILLGYLLSGVFSLGQ